MKFTKIKVNEKSVELVWSTTKGETTITESLTSKEAPTPALVDALQCFKNYVTDLLGLPEKWYGDLRISGLSLDEEAETGLRGLIVTAIRKVERADNRVLVLNTPRMRQASDEGNQKAKTLDDVTLGFVEKAERAAEAFVKGERVQVDMFTGKGDDAPDEAEKPKRRKKGEPFVPGVGGVWNPDSKQPPTEEQLRKLMLEKGCDVPLQAIGTWTATEYRQAIQWATAKDIAEPPAHVAKAATASLWDEGAPPKVSADGAQELQAAVEAGD